MTLVAVEIIFMIFFFFSDSFHELQLMKYIFASNFCGFSGSRG